MSIYLDIIWLLNVLFDTLLLYLTAIFLKRDIQHLRMFLGGLIGSSILLLSFTPLSSYSSHPTMKLGISILMVLSAFGYKRFKYFLSGVFTLYLSTFLIGGVLIGTHYFIQFDFQLSSSMALAEINGFGDPISWIFILFGFPIAWYFSKRKMNDLITANISYDHLVNVEFTINGKEFNMRGLVDSGNQLYDPISKLPVMVVSLKKMEEHLPPFILEFAKDPDQLLFRMNNISSEWGNLLRIIPCRVVGKEQQLLAAYKVEKIVVKNEQKKWEITKGLITFSTHSLSADDKFECIVHPKMMTGSSSTIKYVC